MTNMPIQRENHTEDSSQYRTMQEIVVDRLQQSIRQGYLRPGHKLVYSDIAKEMKVSITPVREAMKTLEAMGLVTIRPHRTAFVTYLTDDEVRQLYAMRKLLEGLATQLAVERITQEELLNLRGVYEKLDSIVATLNGNDTEVLRSEHVVSLQRRHDDFHLGLYAACGNKYLYQMIQLLRGQVTTYFPVINRYDLKRVNRSHRQHLGILAACEQRKPKLAAKLMRDHLRQQVSVLIGHIDRDSLKGNAASEIGSRSRAITRLNAALHQDTGHIAPESDVGVYEGTTDN